MSSVEHFLSESDVTVLPSDVFFGDVVYKAGGTYGPRVQPTYQLLLIHSGHAKIYIDGQKNDLNRGEVALLKPGHQEFFQFSEETRTHHRWCHFKWHLPEAVVQKIESLAFGVPLSRRMEHLIDLGLSLQHDPYALDPLLKHLAAAVFWEFISTQASQLSSARHATLPISITRVQTYIVQNYSDDITLRTLSQIASVSPEHLNRLFRRHLDTTPIYYLWQVRVQQGISNLRHTGLAIEEIAYQCGFKTAAHFSRSVKAQYGQTPSQVRARHWQYDEDNDKSK